MEGAFIGGIVGAGVGALFGPVAGTLAGQAASSALSGLLSDSTNPNGTIPNQATEDYLRNSRNTPPYDPNNCLTCSWIDPNAKDGPVIAPSKSKSSS
jgi:hypothetical protein